MVLVLGPGILRDCVQARAGEVEPRGTAVSVHPLGLEAGQQAQRLGVALESADAGGDVVQRRLAVVPERRMSEVVRQTCGVNHVRVTPKRGAELTADLGNLERMRQPVADEVIAVRLHHLGLGRQPPQRCRVKHPCAVPGEVIAVGLLVRRVLTDPTLAVGHGIRAHNHALYAGCSLPGHPRPIAGAGQTGPGPMPRLVEWNSGTLATVDCGYPRSHTATGLPTGRRSNRNRHSRACDRPWTSASPRSTPRTPTPAPRPSPSWVRR